MNAHELLRQYEKVADAPTAIARLRRFILDLAVRGKLVPQDAGDAPANTLLDEIDAKRAELDASTRATIDRSQVDVSEVPFELPRTWVWTRLGRLTSYIQRGKSPKYADSGGSPVVSQKCVQWSGLDLSAARMVTMESLADYDEVRFLRGGDLLWNSTGTGTIGRVNRLIQPPIRLVCDSHVTVVRCLGVVPEYVRTWLRSDHVYGSIEGRAAGSTNQVELTGQMAISQLVPLPPLAEQHRIVAKVDELMALCDRLEAARAEREAARDRLTAASLARLNTPDPETFREDARFAVDALPALTARSDHIGQLRQALVGVAVRGRLLPQFSSDESADRALRRLLEHKQALIAKKQVRQGKVSQPAGSEGPSTELPKGWVWARVDDLCFKVTDGTHFTPKYTSSGIRFVSAKDIVEGKLTFERCKFISPEEHKELYRRCNPEWHDIVISKSGSIGSVALVEDRGEFSLFESLALLKFDQATINPRFLVYSLRHACASLKAGHVRGIGVKHLHLDVLRGLTLALPPPDEQGRIVAKLDELMALCGQLEAALTASEVRRRDLLESLLHEALEPASTEGEVA